MANNRWFEVRSLVAPLLLAGIAGSAGLAVFAGSAVPGSPESAVVTSADDKWDSAPHTPDEGAALSAAARL